jgi:hypothetical protein
VAEDADADGDVEAGVLVGELLEITGLEAAAPVARPGQQARPALRRAPEHGDLVPRPDEHRRELRVSAAHVQDPQARWKRREQVEERAGLRLEEPRPDAAREAPRVALGGALHVRHLGPGGGARVRKHHGRPRRAAEQAQEAEQQVAVGGELGDGVHRGKGEMSGHRRRHGVGG